MAGYPKPKPYRYFDTPEGVDLDKKLWFVLKPAILTSGLMGTLDVMLYSHPKTHLATLSRYLACSVPIIGTTVTFVVVSNTLANLRKKDDMYNWNGGAVAAAGVVQACFPKARTGFAYSAAIFMIIASITKHYIREGVDVNDFSWMVPRNAGVKLQPDRSLWPEKITFNYVKKD